LVKNSWIDFSVQSVVKLVDNHSPKLHAGGNGGLPVKVVYLAKISFGLGPLMM
jgi:hypothetical protein